MAANTARSYSSDHVEGGYNDRAIHLSTAEVGVQFAELAAEIITVLTDDDPSNDRIAVLNAAIITEQSSHLSHMAWTAADGNRSGAKKLAQNMVQRGKK